MSCSVNDRELGLDKSHFQGKFSFMTSYIFTTTEPTELTERGEKDSLTGTIIGAAIEVHRELGPGLLESAYEACLIYELRLRKLKVENQKPLPVFYKSDCKRGLLINFNVKILKEGIRRLKIWFPLSVSSVGSVV